MPVDEAVIGDDSDEAIDADDRANDSEPCPSVSIGAVSVFMIMVKVKVWEIRDRYLLISSVLPSSRRSSSHIGGCSESLLEMTLCGALVLPAKIKIIPPR